jgi:hypothetical protein
MTGKLYQRKVDCCIACPNHVMIRDELTISSGEVRFECLVTRQKIKSPDTILDTCPLPDTSI